jgi:hypothetical protein
LNSDRVKLVSGVSRLETAVNTWSPGEEKSDTTSAISRSWDCGLGMLWDGGVRGYKYGSVGGWSDSVVGCGGGDGGDGEAVAEAVSSIVSSWFTEYWCSDRVVGFHSCFGS